MTPEQQDVFTQVIALFMEIRSFNNLKDPKIYTVIDEEIRLLEDTLSAGELAFLRNYIQEIYLLIRNHE